jgi:HTH-type transcriptional regulator/antitoxin MqsA
MKTEDYVSCPLCGGKLVREVREINTEYRGYRHTYKQPGQYCLSCGEGFFHPRDLDATAPERKDFDRSVDRLLTSTEIRSVRSKLKLSQKRAGEIFGGGPMAFSKYERGQATQSRSTDILLRLLAASKITLGDIEEVEKDDPNWRIVNPPPSSRALST